MEISAAPQSEDEDTVEEPAIFQLPQESPTPKRNSKAGFHLNGNADLNTLVAEEGAKIAEMADGIKNLNKTLKDGNDAIGIYSGRRILVTTAWEDLATELNAHGPPCKTADGWRRVWKDWKQKKIATNKKETRATGGGPFQQEALTASEDAIAVAIDLYQMVEGIAGAEAFGLGKEDELPAPLAKRPRKEISAAPQSEDEDTVEEPAIFQLPQESPTPKRNSKAGFHLNGNADLNTLVAEEGAKIAEMADGIKNLNKTLKDGNDAIVKQMIKQNELIAENNRLLNLLINKNI
ncbi:uncharacterized protein [Drosophila takahashii]|uniref:uncharacterized protein n=1 Tax=Drosophila takahashii TaxID=29030 RepID=UPI00389965AD